MSDNVVRGLYCYELFEHIFEAGTNTVKESMSTADIVSFFEEAKKKQKGDIPDSKYFYNTQKGTEFIVVDDFKPDCIKFRIVLRRENALPFVETKGKLESLDELLTKDKNIAEVTHCIFFAQTGILGAEYNFSGARPGAIADIISAVKSPRLRVSCSPKLNYDAYEKLIEGEEYTLFDFGVSTNSEAYNEVLSNITIFRIFKETVPDSDTIEVVLKKRKTKKNGNAGFNAPLSVDQMKELTSKYPGDVKKLTVSQEAISSKIDLLSDKFVKKIDLKKNDNRTIDSKMMYREIEKFYTEEVAPHCKKRG